MGSLFKFDFKNPRFRLGGGAALSTIIVVTGAVLANLVAARIPLKLDLSDNKLYSLSDRSSAVIEALEEDVVLYACYKEGSALPEIAEALKRYDEASPKISLHHIDLDRDPGFASRYAVGGEPVQPGGVVVAGTKSGRYRSLSGMDLYDIGYDPQTGQQTVQGVQLEARVSGALSYVSSGEVYRVYELTGHGEETLEDYGLAEEMARQNYVLSPLNLLSAGSVPQDAALLAIIAPRSDVSEADVDALRAYLEKGGDLLILLDPGSALQRLEEALSLYGVERLPGLVMEGSETARLAGNPFFLLPELVSHAIVNPLSEKRIGITFPIASPLGESTLHRKGVEFFPLLRSTTSSWRRADIDDNDPTRKPDDEAGPWTLAYAAELKEYGRENSVRIVAAGSSFFVSPMNPAPVPGNRDLFLNMASWVVDHKEGAGISPKYFISLPFQTDGFTALILLALFVVVLPFGMFAAGLVVWLRRRNR